MAKGTINYIVTLKPDLGQTNVTENFKLPAGKVVSIAAYSRGNESETKGGTIAPSMVFLRLKDDSNGDIIPMLPLENYRQSGGEYQKSFKPLLFDTLNKNYSLVMNTERATTNDKTIDITVWVVFNYEQK